MTFDELPVPWHQANEGLLPSEKRQEFIEFIARTCRKVERLEASVVRRDVVESAIALLCCAIFGAMFLYLKHPVARSGAALVALGCLYVIFQLHRARSGPRKSEWDDSVRDFCEKELERLESQVRLLRSVAWWYICPLVLGANLVVFGVAGAGTFSLIYLVSTLLFSWGVYAFNQRAVAKYFSPAITELNELRRELGEQGEFPSSHPE
jgi:hypothetical protein